MKKVIINSVMAISMLLITVLAVGLGIESVWVWCNRISPAWWWCAPFGIVESFCVLALVGYVSIVWMCGQINK